MSGREPATSGDLLLAGVVLGAADRHRRDAQRDRDPEGTWRHEHWGAHHSHPWRRPHFHPGGDSAVMVEQRHRARHERGDTTTALGRPVATHVHVIADWDRYVGDMWSPPDTSELLWQYPDVLTPTAIERAGQVADEFVWRCRLLRLGAYGPDRRRIPVGWARDALAAHTAWQVTQAYWWVRGPNRDRWLRAFRAHAGRRGGNHAALVDMAEIVHQYDFWTGTIGDMFAGIAPDLPDDAAIDAIARRFARDGRAPVDEDTVARHGVPELAPVYGPDGWLGSVPDVRHPAD